MLTGAGEKTAGEKTAVFSQPESSRAARTGNASLDFLPSLIHDYVSIFRKVTAENENLPGPQLVYYMNICVS